MNRFNNRGTRSERFSSSENRPFQKPRFSGKPRSEMKSPGFGSLGEAGIGEALDKARLEEVKRSTIAAQAGMSKPSMLWLRTTTGAVRFVKSYATQALATDSMAKFPAKKGEFVILSSEKPTDKFIQDNLTNPKVVRAGV